MSLLTNALPPFSPLSVLLAAKAKQAQTSTPVAPVPMLSSVFGGPKPTTTTVGTNVLLKGTPSPVDVPLPQGNSGVVLPAGVQKTDLPPTSILPPGANLATPNLKPLLTPTAQPTSLSSTPVPIAMASLPSNGPLPFGLSWSQIGIGIAVIILLIVAAKHRG